MLLVESNVFKPESRVLTGSLGFDRVNPTFFINQNDVVLVKKLKKNSERVATRFLIGSYQVTGSTRRVSRVFNYFYFFINQTRF